MNTYESQNVDVNYHARTNRPTEEKEENEGTVAAAAADNNNAEENGGECEGIKPHRKNGSS